MKFAVVVLAVVAAASAQVYNPGQYNPGQYNPSPFNAGQYNPYNPKPYNRYNQFPAYKPFVSTTPTPVVSFAPTYAPPTPVAPRVIVPKTVDGAANIVRYDNEINPDGSYSYTYETDNGIAAQETGVPKNLGGNPPVAPDVASGSFSFTSPEGVPVSITYVADENGFQPQGNVLPVAPEIPPQIARALAYIAANRKL